MGLWSSRTVKQSGNNARDERKLTYHGSKALRGVHKNQGWLMQSREKPGGPKRS